MREEVMTICRLSIVHSVWSRTGFGQVIHSYRNPITAATSSRNSVTDGTAAGSVLCRRRAGDCPADGGLKTTRWNRLPGSRRILDAADAGEIGADVIAARLRGGTGRQILALRTGHADSVHNRKPEYWRDAPRVAPGSAAEIARAGFTHVAVDFSCDDIPARRPDGDGGYRNPNGAFRAALHAEGLLLTENCANLGAIGEEESFFVALPYAIPQSATAPCRPIALSDWPSDAPRIVDVSTPVFNHWRWKFDIWHGRSHAAGDNADEIHFVITGHGFTHCDAPCHMRKGAAAIQELPNEGLDLFIGESVIADLSDLGAAVSDHTRIAGGASRRPAPCRRPCDPAQRSHEPAWV